MADIEFRRGTLEEFNRIRKFNDNTLYIVEDAGRIYKGQFDVTSSVRIAENYDDLEIDNTLPSTLYIDPLTLRVKIRYIFNGVGKIDELIPGYVSSISDEDDPMSNPSDSLVTQSYVVSLIKRVLGLEDELNEVSEGNKVVVTFDEGLGNSGYTLGGDEIRADTLDEADGKKLATEKAVMKIAKSEADKAAPQWSVFGQGDQI